MINNSVSINCHLVFFSSIIQYSLPFTVINDLMGIFTSNKKKFTNSAKSPLRNHSARGDYSLYDYILRLSLKPSSAPMP